MLKAFAIFINSNAAKTAEPPFVKSAVQHQAALKALICCMLQRGMHVPLKEQSYACAAQKMVLSSNFSVGHMRKQSELPRQTLVIVVNCSNPDKAARCIVDYQRAT